MISKSHPRKAPTQDPTKFYRSEQQGGSQGKPTNVPEKLKSGPMREPLLGRRDLGDYK